MAVNNHPVTVRLAPTNYSPFSGSVHWNDFTNPLSLVIPHGSTDGVFPDALIRTIPNNLYNIKDLCDEPQNPDVYLSQQIEIEASYSNPKKPFDSFRGGAYIDEQRAITTQTVNATVGQKTTFDLSGHAGCFVEYARSKGATAFNLFMHGRCDRNGDFPPSQQLFESSTIAAPQGGIDNPEFFDNQDPRISSYVTFKSSDAAPGGSITSNLISFRKSFDHGFVRITRDNMAGMSMASGVGGKAYLTSFGAFNWGNVQGLSAGGRCTINTYSTTQGENETAQANGIGNQVPGSVSCSGWVGTFEGIFGTNARFSNSAAASLFRNRVVNSYEHNGAISSADSTYSVGSEPTRYQLSPTSSLSIRPEYAPMYGDKNYLAIGPRVAATPRLSTLNIVPGSYIRISGSASNNGIYQVLSIEQGIPGDTNENTRIGGGPLYEYIELSRAITVEPSSSTKFITIENVSDLPILHIKYRQPVTP